MALAILYPVNFVTKFLVMMKSKNQLKKMLNNPPAMYGTADNKAFCKANTSNYEAGTITLNEKTETTERK